MRVGFRITRRDQRIAKNMFIQCIACAIGFVGALLISAGTHRLLADAVSVYGDSTVYNTYETLDRFTGMGAYKAITFGMFFMVIAAIARVIGMVQTRKEGKAFLFALEMAVASAVLELAFLVTDKTITMVKYPTGVMLAMTALVTEAFACIIPAILLIRQMKQREHTEETVSIATRATIGFIALTIAGIVLGLMYVGDVLGTQRDWSVSTQVMNERSLAIVKNLQDQLMYLVLVDFLRQCAWTGFCYVTYKEFHW